MFFLHKKALNISDYYVVDYFNYVDFDCFLFVDFWFSQFLSTSIDTDGVLVYYNS